MMSEGAGRPTKYKQEYNDQAYKLCLLGATRKALAIFFKVPDATIYNWCKINQEFKDSIIRGCAGFSNSGDLLSGIPKEIIESSEYLKSVAKARPNRRSSGRKKYATKIGKVEACLRARLYHAVKGNVKRRSIKGLPFNTDELISHIEKLFTDGMCWENYGSWHIDHIKPCVGFDQTNESDFNECWSLVNLQPLWARENMLKGAKYECA